MCRNIGPNNTALFANLKTNPELYNGDFMREATFNTYKSLLLATSISVSSGNLGAFDQNYLAVIQHYEVTPVFENL